MAGDLDIVGSAAVDVIPVAPNFHNKMKAIALPAAQRVGEEAGRRFGDAMSRHITVAIPSAINNGGNAARNASTRAGNDNAGAFGRAFKSRLQVAFQSLPKPDVRLGTTGLDADLARVRARMEALSGKRIGVDIDAETAFAELEAIDAKLAELGSRSPNIQVRSDIATARAELAQMQRLVDDLDRDDVRIRVTANTAQANAALMQLAVALGAVAAIPLIPIAAAGIGAIASAAVVATAGVGALALAAIPAVKGVTSAIQAKTAAEKEATSATDNSAAASVRAAQSALQMQNAQQSLASAHRNAARSIEQANRQVEDAERALGQAAVRAMEQREQAAERVEQAERSLVDAKRQARQAEEDLTRAREDAARQLEDLNAQLERGKLDERDATLRVQEAQEELNRVQAEYDAGKATDLQLQRAQLAYDQSVQAADQQKKDYAQLQKDAEAAKKAGVDGNEDVKRAVDQLANAQQNVQSQTEAVAQAHRDAAQAQVEAAQTVTDAQRNLADAVKNAADTQVQAAESIASAERGVEAARLSSIDTTATATTKADEYRKALAKLTPEQRALYDSIAGPKGLTAAYKAWSKELQPHVLPLFTRAVDGAKNSLPGLTPLVQTSADAIGELMDRASADMKRPFWQRFKQGITESAKPAIIGLGIAFGNTFKGIAGIVDAFFPHMDSISERMQRITGRFANWGTNLRGSPKFERFLDYASEMGPIVAESLGDIGGAFLEIGRALSPLSGPLFKVLGAMAEGIATIAENAPWLVQGIWLAVVATKAWTLAMIAFNFVAKQNIFVRIAILIGVVIAAVVLAYQKWDWFREAVQATWSAIQIAAQWAWTKVLKPVFEGIWGAIQWVGDALTWLWKNVFVPAWNIISTVAKYAAAILLTVVFTPIWLAIQAVGAILGWLWEDCFKPTWDLIAGLATWVWDNVLSPFFKLVWDGIKWIGDKFVWLYNHAVKPAMDWISSKAKWLWEHALKPAFRWIWDGLKWLGDKFKWLYDHSVKPAWDWVSDKTSWLYDKALKPAFDKMKSAVKLVGDAFGEAKKAIKSAWDAVAGIVAKPANFVIDVVYTHGIKAVWDKVAGFVGLDKLPAAPKLLDETPKFADGGRTRGGIPGKDSIPALLMEDEYVIRRDSARKIGFGVLEQMNRTGEIPGVQKFADGGIVGALSGAWDWTKDTVSGVVDGAVDWAKAGADLMVNPGKVWAQLMAPILRDVTANLGGAQIGKTLAAYPPKMASGLKDKIVDAVSGFFSGGGDGGGGGNGVWARPVNAPFGTRFGVAGPMWSSGYHTGLDFPAATGTPVYAAANGTVATAGGGGPYGNHILVNHGGGLASLYAHLSKIVTSVGDAVTRGQTIGAVGATGNVTGPHLHFEARRNGRTIDPMPFLYDDGGYLQPGMNLVANGTGKPEPVLTSEQWAAIGASKGSGRPLTINVESKTLLDGQELKGVVVEQINLYDGEIARDLHNGRVYI
ncbi:peptidoglycan DD-metalloendopeptidase family protein [Streptomyces sp. HC307]|uniref:peptidoglycan DD-metalloendopeptidase family protein n=1 Tax=Streptomyces flavusporus TaxID=3385496 RepID=UPI003916E3C0